MFLTTRARLAQLLLERSRSMMLTVCLLLAVCINVDAQYNTSNISYGEPRSNYGISLNSGIDVPLATLKSVYNPAPYFSAEFLRFRNNFTFGIGFGYRSFTAKQGNYSQTDSTGTASASISNFNSYMLYTSITYNINLNKNTLLFIGLNTGYYFTTYGISASSSGNGLDYNISANQSEEEGYLAPKIGLGFKLSDEIQLNVQAAYNIFYSTGYSYNYDSNSGTTVSSSANFFQSISAGASLIYHF